MGRAVWVQHVPLPAVSSRPEVGECFRADLCPCALPARARERRSAPGRAGEHVDLVRQLVDHQVESVRGVGLAAQRAVKPGTEFVWNNSEGPE